MDKIGVERVLEVYQIYKRQIAQEKMLAAPFSKSRAGVGHGSLGQLDPGSTTAMLMCPSCFSDWQGIDNKVQGKCKLCQKNVIAVDKGPPSAEIKLGTASWYMFCGPQGVTWHTDADEAQKENASVNIGAWAQPPPPWTDLQELSFADQVPMALRLSLAHTVASQPFDEVQFAKKTHSRGLDAQSVDSSFPPPAGRGDGDQEEERGSGRATLRKAHRGGVLRAAQPPARCHHADAGGGT